AHRLVELDLEDPVLLELRQPVARGLAGLLSRLAVFARADLVDHRLLRAPQGLPAGPPLAAMGGTAPVHPGAVGSVLPTGGDADVERLGLEDLEAPDPVVSRLALVHPGLLRDPELLFE